MKGKPEQKAARPWLELLMSGLVWEPGAHFRVALSLRNSPARARGWEAILVVSRAVLVWFPERHRGTSGGPGQPLSIARSGMDSHPRHLVLHSRHA